MTGAAGTRVGTARAPTGTATAPPQPVTVAAWSLHLPDLDPRQVPAALAPALGGERACPPATAHQLLGRKGLLNKDPATRLALCAVQRALGNPPRHAVTSTPPDPRVAVVAASNLGNLASVVGVVRAVRVGGVREVSPLAAPNASSNVLASALAVWFGFGGPNLMICAGATSGVDAVAVGASLLRAGRADRVVVVGAEPDDEVAYAVHARRASAAAPLRAGAACVVLERATPGVPPVGPVVVSGGPPAPGPARLVFTPGGAEPSLTLDVAQFAGDLYGALGVAQTAFAAALVGAAGAGARATVVCGDAADGWRALEVVAGGGR